MPYSSKNIKNIALVRKDVSASEEELQKLKTLILKERKKSKPNKAKIVQYDKLYRAEVKKKKVLDAKLEGLIGVIEKVPASTLQLLQQVKQIKTLSPRTPVACLPIKLETKFKNKELWIRVFPDEIFVKSLEKELTSPETEASKVFWDAIYEIENTLESLEERNAEKRKAVSDILALYGTERTAWILKCTRPTNIIGEDLFSVAKVLTAKPKIPATNLKAEEWTKPATTDVLPDKFAFYLYDHTGNVIRKEFGKNIQKSVQLGIDPAIDNVSKQLYQKGTEWLFNFDKAIDLGLGIKIKDLKSIDLVKGFSKLIVLGVKTSVNANESKALLNDLLENHQYKPGSMEFLESGFATKNTESIELEKVAEKELDSFIATHLKGSLFQSNSNKQRKPDGQLLTKAFGLEDDTFKHVKNANKLDISNAYEMAKILYPSTMGYFADQFTWKTSNANLPTNLRNFFLRNVSGRGNLPALKIDDQAYGILPVTSFSDWSSLAKKSFGESAFEKVINPLYQNIFKPKSLKGLTSQQDIFDTLNLNASSRNFSSRSFLGPSVLINLGGINAVKLAHINSELEKIGILLNDVPDVIEYAFHNEAVELTGPIVDNGKSFARRTLQKSVEHKENYFSLLFKAKDFNEIIQHKYKGKALFKYKDSLLYLFVRYAYLREAVKASINFLEPAKIVNAVAFLDTEFEDLRKSDALSAEMIDYLKIQEEIKILEEPKFLKFVEKVSVPVKAVPGKKAEEVLIGRGPLFEKKLVKVEDKVIKTPGLKPKTVKTSTLSTHSLFLSEKKIHDLKVSTIDFKSGAFNLVNTTISDGAKLRIEKYVEGKVEDSIKIKKNIPVSTSKWDYLNKEYPTITGKKSMSGHLFDSMLKNNVETAALKELRFALNYISDLSVQELENLFTEHIDLCSHRIDGWLLAVVNERLNKYRSSNPQKNGIHLGAYGFVENLKPRKGSGVSNKGFIHAPSLAKAKTAAIARSGFDEYMKGMLDDAAVKKEVAALSIDLSAVRTKKALSFIYGINNGQSINSLLGYQFERALNDNKIAQYIVDYRRKFGTVSTSIVTQGNEPQKKYEANNTIDGKRLVEAYQNGRNVFNHISNLSTTHKNILSKIIMEVDDTLDALSDLLHAETIYQIVNANYSNLGATLKSLNNFTNIPMPEVVNTEIHGLKHENRIAYFFTEKGNDKIWSGFPTLKSSLNPWVNEWIGTLLPKPKKIMIQVRGFVLKNDAKQTKVVINESLNVQDIFDMEAIDFCANFPIDLKIPKNYIEQLVKVYIDDKYKSNLVQWENIIINYEDIPKLKADEYALDDVAFMIEQVNTVLKKSKILKASDLASNKEKDTFDDNELAMLTDRYNAVVSQLSRLDDKANELKNITDTFPAKYNESHRGSYRDFYKILVNNFLTCNLSGTPQFEMYYNKESHQAIIDFGNQQVSQMKNLLSDINANLVNSNDLSIDNVKQLLNKLTIQGEYVMIPFSLPNTSQLRTTFKTQSFINTKDLNVHDWLYNASKVKANLNSLILLDQTLATKELSFKTTLIKQLPFDSKIEEQWMATDFNPKILPENSRISFVLSSFNKEISLTKRISGLLIEEWDEIIPDKEIDTGVAFHYDQPNAKSPKNILLAIPPKADGKWEWDHLINTIDETISLAKVRGVNFEDISDTVLNYFLPATIAPIHEDEKSPSLDYLKNNG